MSDTHLDEQVEDLGHDLDMLLYARQRMQACISKIDDEIHDLAKEYDIARNQQTADKEREENE